jgi:hypothetical protein
MPVPVTGEVTDMSEIGPLALFVMVIVTAELPRSFAAVTVTRDKMTPFLVDEAATAGVANARVSPLHAAIDHNAASDFLTSEYYQP